MTQPPPGPEPVLVPAPSLAGSARLAAMLLGLALVVVPILRDLPLGQTTRTGILAWLLVGLALYWIYAGLGSRPLLLLQLVIFSVAATLLTTKAGLVIVGIDRLSILRRTAKTLIMVGAGLAGLNLGALLLASLKRREPPVGGPRQA